MRRWVQFSVSTAALLVLLPTLGMVPLQAKVYKNPVVDYGAGKYAVGVDLGSFSREYTSEGLGTASVDYSQTVVNVTLGIGSTGALGLHLGTTKASVEGGTALSGGGTGLSFRYSMDPPGTEFRKGFLLSHFWGYVEDSYTGVWYSQSDAMFGMSKPMDKTMNLYFGGGLSLANLELEQFYSPWYTYTATGGSSLGAFAGVDFEISPQALAGLELHLLHETGFGVYVDLRF